MIGRPSLVLSSSTNDHHDEATMMPNLCKVPHSTTDQSGFAIGCGRMLGDLYDARIGELATSLPFEVREPRGKRVRQMIERAYLKAKRRASRRYCYVGDVHASKTPVTEMVQRKVDKWSHRPIVCRSRSDI